MTALGILYPGHPAEDDYPRIEQLLGSDIRVDLVRTEGEERLRGATREDVLRELGAPQRLAAGVEELRLAGAEAVVWASTEGSFVHGWDGALEQARSLAVAAGMPASSTAIGFVHAARELGVRRVAVGSTAPREVTALFGQFLRAAGLEVVSVRAGADGAAADGAGWGEAELRGLVGEADHPDAEALLLPDAALRTAAHLTTLERGPGKPVLTASQVTVWEGLRLADRRVNAPVLGALFTREPLVQA
jgi:maleate cis-trans isomerase